MYELILDIMASTGTDTFSFCYADILTLLANSYVKAEETSGVESIAGVVETETSLQYPYLYHLSSGIHP